MAYISLAKTVRVVPKDPKQDPFFKYEYIKTLKVGPKNQEKICKLKTEHLIKGEKVFILVTVENPKEKMKTGGNRRQRRFQAKLMRSFLRKMMRKGRQESMAKTEEIQKKVDAAVDEEFEKRESGLVIPHARNKRTRKPR
jgi:hypothetical protein